MLKQSWHIWLPHSGCSRTVSTILSNHFGVCWSVIMKAHCCWYGLGPSTSSNSTCSDTSSWIKNLCSLMKQPEQQIFSQSWCLETLLAFFWNRENSVITWRILYVYSKAVMCESITGHLFNRQDFLFFSLLEPMGFFYFNFSFNHFRLVMCHAFYLKKSYRRSV